jgi:hypothetical protein
MGNKTSYEEEERRNKRQDGSEVYIYMMCVTRKGEGLALVSVVRAEP